MTGAWLKSDRDTRVEGKVFSMADDEVFGGKGEKIKDSLVSYLR